MSIEDHRSVLTEHMLEELGVAYELHFLSLAEIDTEASRRNQARLEAQDLDRVARYSAALEAGARFPAVIACKNGRGKRKLGDGNHRRDAYEACHLNTIAAYDCEEVDEQTFRAIADLANVRLNGAENTQEERLLHADRAVERSGLSEEHAARIFGIKASVLNVYRRANQMRSRCQALGIPASQWRDLGDHVLSHLLRAEDGALAAALSANRAGLPQRALIAALAPAPRNMPYDARVRRQLDALEQATAESLTARALMKDRPTKGRDPRQMLILQLRGCEVAVHKAVALNGSDPEVSELLERIHLTLDSQAHA